MHAVAATTALLSRTVISAVPSPTHSHTPMPTDIETSPAPAAQCPFHNGNGNGSKIQQTAGGGTSNEQWWPKRLKVELLHQHSTKSNPMGAEFDWGERMPGNQGMQ